MHYFNNKNIVLAGGGGFVGSHIAAMLKQYNCNVFIPHTVDGWDFRKLDTCIEYFQKTKPDIVINCAANQGGVAYHIGKQADLFYDNILMGTFLMHASQQTGVKKFVNVVAGCAYPGYLETGVLTEDDFWKGWLHDSIFSYGFPRKASTVYGMALKKQHNFNSIHLLMANMYGPGDHFNPDQSKALAALMRRIVEAKRKNLPTVEIWGSGKPERDWLYVKDGAEGILRATELYNDVTPLNIATGVGISIKKLAESIKKEVGYKGAFVYNKNKPDGALHKILGVSKMKKVLHWTPSTPLVKGIHETAVWFEKNYIQTKEN